MGAVLDERELEFDFRAAPGAERLDQQDSPQPEGMKLVDFVVTEPDRVLLVEVKDPPGTPASRQARQEFAQRLAGDQLINGDLVPKARDSYTYLHLMRRDDRPFVLVFVLGITHLPLDPALLPAFKDRLLARTRQEGREPWRRQYVADCVVVTDAQWNALFAEYPLTRRPGR